ncbi:MAG: hypothetical protein MUF43_11035 [Flavobacterium sp.]|jgi:hypothetical protein|nr:hypothetical protein [Flavobacterium sp.]
MRDTNEHMIELLSASNADHVFSSLVRHRIADEYLNIRFSIDPTDYRYLKYILEFRPFENTEVASYHYYFALSYRKSEDNQELAYIGVRVEQLDRHKQYEFVLSKKYIGNLLWIHSLKDKSAVEKMIEK